MSIATGTSPIQPEPGLLGQTVVVIGGSAGIGLETARRARAEGAKLILAARNPERLEHASRELGTLSSCGIRCHQLRSTQKILRRTPGTDRPRAGHRSRSLLLTAGGTRDRKGAPAMSKPISCCRCRSLATPQRRFAREAPCSSWAVPVAAARRQDSLSSRLSPPRFQP